jgi:succinyl-diaminopimelate desuccinylase
MQAFTQNYLPDLIELLSIESTEDKPENLKKALMLTAEGLGEYTIETFERGKKPSLLVYSGATRPERFDVLFNAHLDVVPGKPEQFKPEVKDGRLYARGAYDMKPAGLVLATVFKELAKDSPLKIGLQLVTDEEIGGHNGTQLQIESGVLADFVIAGEKTDFDINTDSKGVCWLTITARGTAAHSAYQWNGESATDNLITALTKLRAVYPFLPEESWNTSLNIATLSTPNKTLNSVPDQAEAKLDVRFTADDTIFTNEPAIVTTMLQEIVGQNVTIEIDNLENTHHTDQTNAYVTQLVTSTQKITGTKPHFLKKHGASDVRYYSAQGAGAVTFGVRGDGIHGDGEYVELSSLDTYYEILVDFVNSVQP